MLTADLVCARRRGTELVLSRLGGRQRARAVELGEALLQAAHDSVGATRDELREAWSRIETLAREQRLVDGLRKLVEDRCEFAVEELADPAELRREVFARASEARKEEGPGQLFDRDRVLGQVAAQFGLDVAGVERGLYADLKGAHLLQAVAPLRPEQLVEQYEEAQVQAVLLRAVSVTAEVYCRAPAGYRALFHQLKFRRLLYTIEPADPGYRLRIDGPLSLFESVTKYGLQLALALPALQQCDRLDLVARVRWGKQRSPLVFRHRSRFSASGQAGSLEPHSGPTEAWLPSEVAELMQAFRALGTGWEVAVADRILDLPGVGICVPDLVFRHPEAPEPVLLEVLGYWSRDAVWRRVELVQQGLGARVLFAVSSRLRVSEEVLGEDQIGALYVYKGTMSARAIARRLDAWR